MAAPDAARLILQAAVPPAGNRHGPPAKGSHGARIGDRHEPRGHESFQPSGACANVRLDPHLDCEPGEDTLLVLWRDQEAGDHQLPHVQAGARRPVLRAHLRPDQGLRVPLRQVQADEVQGHHLREVRRRGNAFARSSRAHGPHRTRRSGCAHLVPQVPAEPHRHAARHDAEGHRARSLFRELHRHRAGPDLTQGEPAPFGRGVHDRRRRIRRGLLYGDDRRGGHLRDARRDGSGEDRRRPARRNGRDDVRPQAEEDPEAPEDRREFPRVRATGPSG